MMQADNTHATAEGNKIVAKNILPSLRPPSAKKVAPHLLLPSLPVPVYQTSHYRSGAPSIAHHAMGGT
jgi:hypothetical protein